MYFAPVYQKEVSSQLRSPHGALHCKAKTIQHYRNNPNNAIISGKVLVRLATPCYHIETSSRTTLSEE